MSCVPRRCQKQTGVYPYYVAPYLNQESAIFYATLTNDDGTWQRRAWLIPPTALATPVTVQLETLAQSAGSVAPPQTQFSTPFIGTGAVVPKNIPGTFTTHNADVGLTAAFGCATDADGVLQYTSPCSAGPASDAWFKLTNANPLHASVSLGIPNTAASNNGRVLRAVPTVSTGVFSLAWQNPAALTAGFNVSILLVYPYNYPPPCARTLTELYTAPPGSVVAGPLWRNM